MSGRFIALVGAALLLAIGMATLGVVTANALRERDRAVQDGVLLGIAQQISADLRQIGPERAQEYLNRLLTEKSESIAGVEIAVSSGVVVHAGSLLREPTVTAAALGPSWRQHAVSGEGQRGFGGRGAPPFSLRLYPASTLGHHARMATAVVAVSTATAAALFVLALFAARGLVERERRLTAEAEQQRLHLAAVAGAGLAHRIRTPLATIKGTAQMIEAETTTSRERARRIVDEAGRIDGMVRRLLEFAKPPEPHAEKFDVVPIVRELAARFGPVEVLVPKEIFVFADPVHFETTLEELLTNARAFGTGIIEILVRPDAGDVLVQVRDHGSGLAVEAQQAFEPYVTTRTDGTGLGLSIAQALMRSNGGELHLRNADGGGCVATVRLPEAS